MAAPVLNTFELRSALSVKAKKKKKKVIKNVLGLPSNMTVKVEELELSEVQKLTQILERLLPIAKLPIQHNTKFKKDPPKTDTIVDESTLKLAQSKRSQLSIGVNEVNKGLKKKILSAVLLANDIQPVFLVQHLILLCNHNNTPFLAVPKLRDITKKALGFPCIALGFKNNFSDFSEVVSEIKSVFENQKSKKEKEVEVVSSESEDEEISSIEDFDTVVDDDEEEESVMEFTYLSRSSSTERVFVPDKKENKKSEVDFMSLPKDNNDVEEKKNSEGFKLSSKKKKKDNMLSLKDFDADINSEEYEVPSKKIKKDWVIDTVGNKQKFRYFPTNLVKTQSNPDRIRKKNK